MPIILVGLNHETAPVELREQYSFTECLLEMALGELQLGALDEMAGARQDAPGAVHEVVILSTFNRLEFYAVTAGNAADGWSVVENYLARLQGIPVQVLHRHLYFKEGQDAVGHLMKVACGLDSLILGEPQILGQVTQALTEAHAASTTGPILSHLFAQAIHVGKRARTETDISRHTMSVSHAAALLAQEKFGDLKDARVLIVGAGEMAGLAAHAMKMHAAQDIVCINRTYSRAEELAKRVGGQAQHWYQLGQALTWADVVVSATGAPHTVIYTSDISRILPYRDGRPLICVDIAVPRDIEESAGDLPGVHSYNIDDLEVTLDENLAQRQTAVPQVEAMIATSAAAFVGWLQCRQVVPIITALRRKAEILAQAEVEEALGHLRGLTTHDQEVIVHLVQRLVNKLLHEPTVQLKAQAACGNGYDYAEAIRVLFMLEESCSLPAEKPIEGKAYPLSDAPRPIQISPNTAARRSRPMDTFAPSVPRRSKSSEPSQ